MHAPGDDRSCSHEERLPTIRLVQPMLVQHSLDFNRGRCVCLAAIPPLAVQQGRPIHCGNPDRLGFARIHHTICGGVWRNPRTQ
eukprot:2823926-Alexandrium_andersonii.AAC.1